MNTINCISLYVNSINYIILYKNNTNIEKSYVFKYLIYNII